VNERPKSVEQQSSSSPAFTPGAMWGGVVLIGIGSVFLLQTMNILPRGFNWWAFFILIPGLGMFYKAYQTYQENGRVDGRLRGTLIGATAATMVAVIFLFNLSWGLMWPAMLIAIGVVLFATARS
jgi:hypothetical protein